MHSIALAHRCLRSTHQSNEIQFRTLFCLRACVDEIVSLLEIILDERFSTYIETAEDAHAEEVYYSHMKMNQRTVDENDLDEERM
jgi:hypothetical protein